MGGTLLTIIEIHDISLAVAIVWLGLELKMDIPMLGDLRNHGNYSDPRSAKLRIQEDLSESFILVWCPM